MTVRAWFVISALVIAALGVAFGYRFFAPVSAPEILVRTGSIRLEGNPTRSCWPQRDARLRCVNQRAPRPPERPTSVPSSGTFRIVVAYPTAPDRGSVSISERRADGRVQRVVREQWTRNLRYDLAPGSYVLAIEAGYPAGARVGYVFFFSVTRSGS